MIRPLHRYAGLAIALVACVVALSGAVLAVYPAAETFTTAATAATANVDLGTFAAQVQAAVPGLEEIQQSATGQITAFSYGDGVAGEWIIDPATGEVVAAATHSQFELWLTNLHRALLAGDVGRIVVGLTSLAMAVLSGSGFALALRRVGGWRQLLRPLKGPFAQRWHTELARLAGLGLLLSSLTGLWLFGLTFGLIPEGGAVLAYPEVSGTGGLSPASLTALQNIPLADLSELVFPRADNLGDAFTVETTAGFGYVDQGSGDLLAWSPKGVLDRLSDIITMLHTGQGAAILGLILALSALTVPVLSVTGLMQQAGRTARPSARKQKVTAEAADTIVLVGSEGGATWSFAEALRSGLASTGAQVHVAAMSDFAPERYQSAARVLILAATSGDGDVPGSAVGFLETLAALTTPPTAPFALLGFGDSGFPEFCGYAEEVRAAARATGWQELLPMATVDRQSEQDFARWGTALGETLAAPLPLERKAAGQSVTDLTLISRRDYGVELQAPAATLRFALPRRALWQRLSGRGFGRFQAGDLIGILPAGDTTPRSYSLASASRDGFVEICVRKHPGGLCSGQLMELQPGDSMRAFLRHNPGFHADTSEAPLILIGAGTGIGPLAGFARANRKRRPVHLYYGARSAGSDLFYGEDLPLWQADGRLASVMTAFSRGADGAYVQDILRRDGERIRRLIEDGARIMVCGGRDMAAGVTAALDDILAPAQLCPVTLKAEGRYVEDVY